MMNAAAPVKNKSIDQDKGEIESRYQAKKIDEINWPSHVTLKPGTNSQHFIFFVTYEWDQQAFPA
jgi:hypothetical protein